MARDIVLEGKARFPGVLWILPIFFGFIGGIIAAIIAGSSYHASWWELLLVGFIINVLAVLAYLIFIAGLISLAL